MRGMVAILVLLTGTMRPQRPAVEMTTTMVIDVDGAPNAYGPPGKKTLDVLKNAHADGNPRNPIVGYVVKADGHTPVLQGRHDPYPGYYISTSGFTDKNNDNNLDPHAYVNAAKINYVVLGTFARRHHVHLGDFVAVYSKRTRRAVYGIVGDAGNATGAEGSLALFRALGYPFTNGKTGGEGRRLIVIRYFPGSNPRHEFFFRQRDLDRRAKELGLSKRFP